MQVETLAKFFHSIHPVDQDILGNYTSEWHQYTSPKKTILTAPGETQRNLYFVLNGVQKSYYLHADKEHIMAFTYPPSLSGIPEPFLNQRPSKYFLETITNSTFLRIPYDKHVQYLKNNREIESLFRKITEKLLNNVLERQYEQMAYNMKTRFSIFAERSPHLLNIIPQKDIASYLRMDPTNLSKLLNSVRI